MYACIISLQACYHVKVPSMLLWLMRPAQALYQVFGHINMSTSCICLSLMEQQPLACIYIPYMVHLLMIMLKATRVQCASFFSTLCKFKLDVFCRHHNVCWQPSRIILNMLTQVLQD